MQPVKDSTELSMNDIVLSGSFYFKVAGITPRSFVGKVWNEQSKAWGRSASIPVPSPTFTAYLLDETDRAYLFPLIKTIEFEEQA